MEIPEFIARSYTAVEKITEGCSGDEKYKLEKDGKFFLLRVGDKSKATEKKIFMTERALTTGELCWSGGPC